MNWTVICATNNEAVLNSCLLNSPAITSATEVILERGHSSAASAYNHGIEKAQTDLLVFAHQDVYLPQSWPRAVEQAIQIIGRTDPNWGVLGVYGLHIGGRGVGHLYDAAWRHVLGKPFEGGLEVETLDELLLITRKSSGLRFDDRIRGYHMYGTDICLQARSRGMKAYAIAAFCIHNTSGYGVLPLDFWKTYFLIRKKWKSQLPIRTPCTEITRFCWPIVRWNVTRVINLWIGRDKPPAKRIEDPGKFYQQLMDSRAVVVS